MVERKSKEEVNGDIKRSIPLFVMGSKRSVYSYAFANIGKEGEEKEENSAEIRMSRARRVTVE